MNKVVLVTGAQRGLGRATIIEFAKRGYDVVIDYYEQEELANELKNLVESEYNVRALTVKADVRDEVEVKSMFSAIMDEFGRIDVLVNNAGIVYDRDFEEITVDEFENTLRTNVVGAFLVAREASKFMLDGSAIVNVSSTNGTKTISPECLDYNISKIGLQSLTRDLAFQFKSKVRVNAVAIGWMNTTMNDGLPEEYVNEELAKIYSKRFAEPEEVARTIYFLASEDASYINGEVVTVDSGYYK